MTPVLLEDPGPLVKRPNGVRVGAIEHLPSVAPEAHQSDVTQHFEMLRHGGLTQRELRDDVTDMTFSGSEVDEDVSALGFSDLVEDVRRAGGARHSRALYSHYAICQPRAKTASLG